MFALRPCSVQRSLVRCAMNRNSKGATGAQSTSESSSSAVVVNKKSGFVQVHVRAKPGAKTDALVGIEPDGVALQVTAAARDGEANEALGLYLASLLKLRKNQVKLVSGSKSRQKIFELQVSALTVAEVLNQLQIELKA